jgi:hypothetical protein
MKNLWLIISALALANVLAVGGVVGWLAATDRLSRDRVHKIREMLAKPVAVEEQERLAAEAAAKQRAEEEARAIRLAAAPVPASAQIAAERDEAELAHQRMLRRQREIDDLGAQLVRRQDDLDQRERALQQRIAAFEAEKQRYLEIEGAEQFRAALETLEGLKAKEAKALLGTMLEQGQGEQVVAYLSRMDDRKRSAIVSEFAREQPSLAADLLERLRTRGVATASAAQRTAAPNDPAESAIP